MNENIKIDFAITKKDLVVEINKIRLSPKSYITKIKKYRKYYKDNFLYLPTNTKPIKTIEGIKACEEAIRFLKKQEAVNALINDERLSKAAEDHVNDIGKNGLSSYEGSDGSSVLDRVQKYCEWDDFCCESIDFGNYFAKDIIIQSIIDDGIPSRYNRDNIFSKKAKYIGVHIGYHKLYSFVTDIVLIGNVRETNQISPNVSNFINLIIEYNANNTTIKEKDDMTNSSILAPDNSVKFNTSRREIIIPNGDSLDVTSTMYELINGDKKIIEVVYDNNNKAT